MNILRNVPQRKVPYTNPYRALIAAGIPTDNHESDLYVLATDEALRIVKASGWTYTTFRSNIDGKLWLDLAFAFEPFWERMAARVDTITPTRHEKNEWARMADAAYTSGHNATGHRFSAAAALREHEPMSLDRFDSLQMDYRAWLNGNEYPTT